MVSGYGLSNSVPEHADVRKAFVRVLGAGLIAES
jgi:hypothetical protein